MMIDFDNFATAIMDERNKELDLLEKKINSYFYEIGFFIRFINQQTNVTEKFTSNNFNVFRYIFINESVFSDIISDILNPFGEHGQGNAFLNSFIDLLKIDKEKISTIPVIKREVLTKQFLKTRRRMDLLIDWSNFGIMIENKPKTKDEEEQLCDYIGDLKNKYGKSNFIVIYLSNEGRFPTQSSLPHELKTELEKTNQYYHFTYQREFSNWIKNCINVCQSDKYRWFLRDFHYYILNNYLKS